MPTPTVRSAAAADADQAIAVVVLAFSADPIERWLYRDSRQSLMNFPIFVRAFAGRAFQHASAFVVDDCAGAALWLPPGVAPDEAAVAAQEVRICCLDSMRAIQPL
jgi:hypothetical protein